MKTLIVCASRYGSTLEIGRWMVERIGHDADVIGVEMTARLSDYDLVFLGGGVYNDQVDAAIVSFAEENLPVLKDKKVTVFGTCLDTGGYYLKGAFMGGWRYLEPLLNVLKDYPPVNAGLLHGEINPHKLTDKDTQLLMHFYTKILKRDIHQVPFRTMMNKQEVWEFVDKTMARLEGRF